MYLTRKEEEHLGAIESARVREQSMRYQKLQRKYLSSILDLSDWEKEDGLVLVPAKDQILDLLEEGKRLLFYGDLGESATEDIITAMYKILRESEPVRLKYKLTGYKTL